MYAEERMMRYKHKWSLRFQIKKAVWERPQHQQRWLQDFRWQVKKVLCIDLDPQGNLDSALVPIPKEGLLYWMY